MKKIHTLFIVLFLGISRLYAATITVQVSDQGFKPTNFTANVGDVIKFQWTGPLENHTTTSVTIPSGAASWDAFSGPGSPTFLYPVTKPGNYFYKCTPHAFFQNGVLVGMVANFTVNPVVLPVKLTSFDVSLSNEGTKVKWKTTFEKNVDYFTIIRSNSASNFKEIARIKAAGNSSEEQTYNFTDYNLPNDPFLYYALVTVDLDGTTQYSDTKVLKNQLKASAKLITSISPNPLNKGDHLMISYSAMVDGKLNVKLQNMNGKLVFEDQLTASIGMNNSHLMLPDLESGIYIATFSLGDVKEVYKIQVN